MGVPPVLVGAVQFTVIACGPDGNSVGAFGAPGTVALAVVALARFEKPLVPPALIAATRYCRVFSAVRGCPDPSSV